MDEETQAAQPKKKGWPKGKPRGPRKAAQPQPPIGDPPRPPQPPQPTAIEPISVSAIYKNGLTVTFTASAMEFTAAEYKFWCYPEQRGFKQLNLIQRSEVTAIAITAPERDFEMLKQPVAVPVAAVPVGAPIARREYPAGDPQVSVAPRGRRAPNAAAQIPSPIPMANVVKYDKGELVEETAGASMV